MERTVNNVPIPSFDLTGKVAVVTGGTKGIGYAIAAAYAAYGANVVVSARTAADCEKAAADFKALGVRALGVPADISKADQVDRLIDETMKTMGKIDIMVANAGTSSTYRAFDLKEEEWDRIIDVDLKGVFLTARAAARKMADAGGGGRIINVASTAGLRGAVGISAYTAAKAGVINLSRSLAAEWARYNITVNSICPGYVITDINRDVMDDPKVYDKLVKKTLVRRLGNVEEIAAAALYLASDFSAYTTGTELVVDGCGITT